MPHPWEERWTLSDRLGKGGQGVTYRAIFVDDSTVIGALKYLRNNRDPQARGRMRREVANLQTLANAGGQVPRVLDHNTGAFEDPKVELFVVMDLITGPTLTEHVQQQQQLDIEASIALTLSLCKTVKLAHESTILHRDLKPDNVIIRDTTSYDLMVVDYGLSFNASDEDITETDDTFRNRFLDLPETNTPSGDRRDARSDLTAVCGVLYYCLTGNVPGQLQDASGKLPHRRDGYSIRDAHDGERVGYLEEFLDRGFTPNIANRYQEIGEITSALAELIATDKNFDESDPIQLAAALSVRLRAGDRTTQLAEFREHAQNLFNYITNEAKKYHQKLGRFTLSNGGSGFGGGGFGDGFNPTQVSVPTGLDLVAAHPIATVLQAAHHHHQRHRFFVVASRAEQCVLLAADRKVDSQPSQFFAPQPSAQQEFDWQEIAWYEGNPESIHSLISVSYRDWLTQQMKELAREILGL